MTPFGHLWEPMATTPNPVATTTAPTTTAMVIGHWVTFIKAHEKLLLAVIVAFTILHLGTKVENAFATYHKNAQTQTNTQIATQEATNAALQKQITDMAATVAASNAAANAKIAAAQQALVKQQAADNAMTSPELATRLQALVNVGHVAVDTTPSALPNTLTLDSDAAHAVTSDLEQIPALQTQLSATTDKLNGCQSLLTLSSQSITGLNTSIELEKKGRAEDAKVAADNERKAGRKWFKIGVATGAAAVIAAIAAVKTAF